MKLVRFLPCLLLLLAACGPSESTDEEFAEEQEVMEESTVIPSISDTTIVFKAGDFESSVIVEMPKTSFRGTILVLQGWNFPNTSWSDSSVTYHKGINRGCDR